MRKAFCESGQGRTRACAGFRCRFFAFFSVWEAVFCRFFRNFVNFWTIFWRFVDFLENFGKFRQIFPVFNPFSAIYLPKCRPPSPHAPPSPSQSRGRGSRDGLFGRFPGQHGPSGGFVGVSWHVFPEKRFLLPHPRLATSPIGRLPAYGKFGIEICRQSDANCHDKNTPNVTMEAEQSRFRAAIRRLFSISSVKSASFFTFVP